MVRRIRPSAGRWLGLLGVDERIDQVAGEDTSDGVVHAVTLGIDLILEPGMQHDYRDGDRESRGSCQECLPDAPGEDRRVDLSAGLLQ